MDLNKTTLCSSLATPGFGPQFSIRYHALQPCSIFTKCPKSKMRGFRDKSSGYATRNSKSWHRNFMSRIYCYSTVSSLHSLLEVVACYSFKIQPKSENNIYNHVSTQTENRQDPWSQIRMRAHHKQPMLSLEKSKTNGSFVAPYIWKPYILHCDITQKRPAHNHT